MLSCPEPGKLYSISDANSIVPINGERLYSLTRRTKNEFEKQMDELRSCGLIAICRNTGAYMSMQVIKQHDISMKRSLAGKKGGIASTAKRLST